jgi:uncharacterized protein (TIRG00374 family)
VAALAFWFLWKILGDTGLKTAGDRLLRADIGLAVIAVLLTILRYLLLAARWEILVRQEAPVGLPQITPVLMAGNFLSLVTPAIRIAGPILRAYYLSKETGRARTRFYGTIVADQVSNFAVYAALLPAAGLMVSTSGRMPLSVAGASGLLALLAGGLYVGWRMLVEVERGRPSIVSRMLRATMGAGRAGGWRQRLIAWWEDLLHSLSGAATSPARWWPAMAVSVAVYAVTIATQIFCFRAVGARVGIAETCFAVSGAGFAQILLAAPGGAGVTEASLVALFLALGQDVASAAAGVFLARLINYAVVALWGGAAFFMLQRRYGRPASGEPIDQTGLNSTATGR